MSTATVTPQAPVTAPTAPGIIYLVAWTGGLDDPSFQSFTDQAQARETYASWVSEANDRYDRVTLVEQVLAVDGIILNTKVADYCPGWDGDPDDD